MRKRWILALGFALILIFTAAYLSATVFCYQNVDCLGDDFCVNGGYFVYCKLHCVEGTVIKCPWRE